MAALRRPVSAFSVSVWRKMRGGILTGKDLLEEAKEPLSIHGKDLVTVTRLKQFSSRASTKFLNASVKERPEFSRSRASN